MRLCLKLLLLFISLSVFSDADEKKPRPSSNDERQERTARLNQFHAIVFPTRIPRDVVDGIYGAVENVLKGSLIGMASTGIIVYKEVFTTNSTISYSNLAGGVVVGLAISACGWFHGSVQFIRGISQTPVAVWSMWHGLRWETNEWVVYSIPDQIQRLQAQTTTNNVKDTTYYDVLGIPTTASSKDIKRAYYEKAKELHPDKRSSDSDEEFLLLHEAYYTLKDDDRRSAYNARGESSENRFRMPIFCTIVFGSYKVEQYTGQLTITSILTILEDLHRSKPGIFDWVQLLRTETNLQSRKRQLEVSQHLLTTVRGFVEGTMTLEEFRRSCEKEANSIAESSPFGTKFLQLIARSLKGTATHRQGFCYDFILFVPWRVINTMKMVFQQLKLAFQTFFAIRLIFNRAAKWDQTDAQVVDEQATQKKRKRRGSRLHVTGELIAELLPDLMKAIWVQVELDVTQTVSQACQNAFDDVATDSSNVAKALVVLGNEFSRVAGGICDEDSPITMERLEVAYRIAQNRV